MAAFCAVLQATTLVKSEEGMESGSAPAFFADASQPTTQLLNRSRSLGA